MSDNSYKNNKDIFTKTIEAPAQVLEMTVETAGKFAQALPTEQITQTVIKTSKKGEEYWHNLGPGLTTGASDDDPSGIATYSQAGAQYGFKLLWLAAFT